MLSGQGRVAVYWAPEPDDPLHALGSAWLGRDAATGATLPGGLAIAGVTADARRYGLHAMLKTPFRLAVSWAELEAAATALAARLAPFDLPPLAVQDLSGFLALRETAPCPALHALADLCVETLDACRAPPTAADLARRRATGLTPAQEAMLARWGYPYVFGEWRFHVMLTRRLTPEERAVVLPAAVAHLGGAAARPRRVASICLFTQSGPDAPFLLARRLPLRAGR